MNIEKPIIICNDDHKFIVKDQINKIEIECDIFLEPISKNTTPSITLAALMAKPETNLLVLPADHMIDNKNFFTEQIENACSYLNEKNIIVFGIKPTQPNINYGYIEALITKKPYFYVKSFKEKPSQKLAKLYLNKGTFFWNSGIYAFRSTSFLEELKIYQPEILKVGMKVIEKFRNQSNFKIFDKTVFSKFKNISIDYSIMEYTKKAIMFPLDCKWSDLGTWSSVMENTNKNKDGNVIRGNVLTSNTFNSLIYNLNNKILATDSIKDLIIVDTKDSLLVTSLKKNKNMKLLVEKIKKKQPQVLEKYPDENRPWGSFESILKLPGYQIKKIIVKPGGKLSLQRHKFRSEHWVVVSGIGNVIKGKDSLKLKKGESIYIPKQVIHSLENISKNNLIIIEVQIGDYLEEDDIERFGDVYGRK